MTSEKQKSKIEKVADDLFEYAIDREDVRWLMERLPEAARVKRSAVEYELPILKIICVGWCVSYYLEGSARKDALQTSYWEAIREFSRSLSTTTEMMAGVKIDYFEVIKERLDGYVGALGAHPDATEPATVIGPVFAQNCGDGEDLSAFLAGSKMFMSTVRRVREYLEAVRLR